MLGDVCIQHARVSFGKFLNLAPHVHKYFVCGILIIQYQDNQQTRFSYVICNLSYNLADKGPNYVTTNKNMQISLYSLIINGCPFSDEAAL